MTRSDWTAAVNKLEDIRAQLREIYDSAGIPGSMWPREFRVRLYWAEHELQKAQLAAGKAALKAVA